MPADDRTKHIQRLALDPGDGHLRCADPPRHLSLPQSLVVPHADRSLQSLREAVDRSLQQDPVLDSLERGIIRARPAGLLLTVDHRRIERRRAVRSTNFERFDRSLEPDAAFPRHLSNGRRAAKLLGQSVPRAHQPMVQFPKPPRDANRPEPIAKVTPELPEDRGRRIRGELHTAGWIEAIDGLEQTDGRDLDKVVNGLAAIGEPAGQRGGPWGMRKDQMFAQCLILRLPEGTEYLMKLLRI